MHPLEPKRHQLKEFSQHADAESRLLCYNPNLHFLIDRQETSLVFLRFRSLLTILLVVVSAAAFVFSQETSEKKAEAKPAATPNPKDPAKPVTADQVVDSAIIIYGFPGGRVTLNQIRKTTLERGRMTIFDSAGKSETSSYQRWIIRGESLAKEKIRLDQDFPSSRYSLVFADEKIFGIFNNTMFAPRADVANAFSNSIYHGLEALFRWKENESKIELAGREKIMGVEYHLIDVTDKMNRKTRFYISVKTFRVMQLTYEDGGVEYRRKFYDHNYAQGTLVASRSVLTAGDKTVEETTIGTITFGQKVEEELFREIKP